MGGILRALPLEDFFDNRLPLFFICNAGNYEKSEVVRLSLLTASNAVGEEKCHPLTRVVIGALNGVAFGRNE
jgi:hypothetical protein